MERHRGTKPCSHLIEELQHDGEHVRVGFVHLIEQHHGVGALPQLLGQLPALLVAHVTRRGADELGHLGGGGCVRGQPGLRRGQTELHPLQRVLLGGSLKDSKRRGAKDVCPPSATTPLLAVIAGGSKTGDRRALLAGEMLLQTRPSTARQPQNGEGWRRPSISPIQPQPIHDLALN